MPGIDNEVDQILQPQPVHFFKSMSSQCTQVCKKKKACKGSCAVPGSGHLLAFLLATPHPSTPAFNNDGGSSDIKVSKVMDHCDLMKHAHDGQESHLDTPAHKQIKPSVGSSCPSFASHSSSPMMVDSWTSSEELPSMHPSVPSFSTSSS